MFRSTQASRASARATMSYNHGHGFTRKGAVVIRHAHTHSVGTAHPDKAIAAVGNVPGNDTTGAIDKAIKQTATRAKRG